MTSKSTQMQAQMARKKADLHVKIKEQEVLQYELSSLKPKAKVYKKQQNSNVLFLSGMEQEMQHAKKNLDSLQKEYQGLQDTSKDDTQEDEEEADDTS